MPTATVEDYLKAILLEEQRGGDALVTMGQVAAALEVAPGTVTSMVKTLDRAGLVAYEPYAGVRLSDEGRGTALRVLRRHRLIELFLVEKLGLDWSEVHDEAERLEHVMSDRLIEAIDEQLGRPRVDPHGDPIPDAGGALDEPEWIDLREAPADRRLRVARVSDQDETFLRFVERRGLKPGAEVRIEQRDVEADAWVLDVAGRVVLLGGEAAAKIWIEPIDP
ncbi:MAG: metal-dependent transcriptional regulator [Acidobacteriota bacterium]